MIKWLVLTAAVPSQTPESSYRRLANDQPVGLRHTGHVINVQDIVKVVICTYVPI